MAKTTVKTSTKLTSEPDIQTNVKIKNILIIYRPESSNAAKAAEELAAWLKKRKLTVFSHPSQKIGPDIKKIKRGQLNDLQLVIVLGGDGTYLQAVRLLGNEHVPILGVNMGSLGFLAATRKEDLYNIVTLALDNKLEKRPRAMICVKVQRNGKTISSSNALNDVVIERSTYSQLINIAIYSENHLVNEVKADGILIATPTGSTAYNLSAGGPILHPYVHALVVTPICPHSLTHRPILFPDDQMLTFRLLNKKQSALLSVDGQGEEGLLAGDEITVTRSQCDHYFLRKPSQNYFELLREKLKFGER